MKLVTVSGGLVLLAAFVPVFARLPAVAAVPAVTESAAVSAVVTPAGEVLTASLPSARTLRLSTTREGAAAHYDLELKALPEGARLLAVQLGAFGPGLAALLAIENGTEVEYRYLFTAGDPLRGELVAGDPTAALRTERTDPWSLSEPLFTSTGEPYRLVDIHNPGGDSLEMTFRRGSMQGVRERSSANISVDERIIHDICPGLGKLMPGRCVTAVVERIAPSP